MQKYTPTHTYSAKISPTTNTSSSPINTPPIYSYRFKLTGKTGNAFSYSIETSLKLNIDTDPNGKSDTAIVLVNSKRILKIKQLYEAYPTHYFRILEKFIQTSFGRTQWIRTSDNRIF